MNEKIFCYFHTDDMDGWASSAVVKKKHPNAEFFGYNYEPMLPLVKGYDTVYMVDCSTSVENMKALIENNEKFVWLDHHAKKIWDTYTELGEGIEGIRDTGGNNSACVLTWQYLFPDLEVPKILKSIEDMDIWKWKLPYSREINTALFIDYKEDRDRIMGLFDDFAIEVDELIESGKCYVKMRQNQIGFLLKTMRIKTFHGHKTGVVNTPIHTSFVGHEILKQNPDIKIAIIWYIFNNLVKVSLRSRGDIDVAEIASLYGGGGHKPASGLTLSIDEIKRRNIYLG